MSVGKISKVLPIKKAVYNLMSKLIRLMLVCLLLVSSFWQATAYTAQFADEGKTMRLRWKTNVIPIVFSTSLIKQNPYVRPNSDIGGAIRRSLETWENASNIKFQVTWSDEENASPAGKVGDGVSLVTIAPTPDNIFLIGSDAGEVSARTRVFFNRKGFITEADIVISPYVEFSTDGSPGTFDFEATLTHEIGHLLGLDHSLVIGATMHEHQGKNGVYNLSGFSPRTLAEDDLTGIRALYGAKDSDQECCGTIAGKLTLGNGKAAKDFQVWAEDAESGQVIAGVLSNNEGDFRIDGLRGGIYKVYTQTYGENLEKASSFENLGEIEVLKDKPQNIVKKLINNRKSFDIQYIGFNGQVSELAVPINSGKSYTIYVGGKNLDSDNITIGFNSPYLSVTPGSLVNPNYGPDISVISFQINVDSKTPFGEYSFFLKNKDDESQFSVGSLTVESVVNNLTSQFLSSDK